MTNIRERWENQRKPNAIIWKTYIYKSGQYGFQCNSDFFVEQENWKGSPHRINIESCVTQIIENGIISIVGVTGNDLNQPEYLSPFLFGLPPVFWGKKQLSFFKDCTPKDRKWIEKNIVVTTKAT